MLNRAGNRTIIGLQVRRRYGTSDSRCAYEIDAENGKDGRVPTYSHITDGSENLPLPTSIVGVTINEWTEIFPCRPPLLQPLGPFIYGDSRSIFVSFLQARGAVNGVWSSFGPRRNRQ